MKRLVFLLFLVSLVFAQNIEQAIIDTLRFVRDIADLTLPVLALTMVVFAAFIYMAGRWTDTQTQARSNVWATAFLTSAVLGIILYLVLTTFFRDIFQGPQSAVLIRYGNVITNVAIALTSIIVIIYAISKVLNNPEWQAYWGIELSQLVASALIVFFAIAFFSVIDSVAGGFTKEFTGNRYDSAPIAASKFLERILLKNITPAVNDLFTVQICLSHLSTFQRRIGEYVLTLTYKLFPAVDAIVQVTNVIVFGFVSILASVYTQIVILKLINIVAVNFILPAGIVLRFIPPTREAGVFLIALAIGMQAVFPLTYMINIETLNLIGFKDYQTSPQVANLCGRDYAVLGIAGNISSTIPVVGPLATRISDLIKTIFTEFTINLLKPLEFTSYLDSVAYLSLVALFLPAFSTTITFAFINAFTKFVNMKM